jgi:hypothetical protein
MYIIFCLKNQSSENMTEKLIEELNEELAA